MSKILDIDPVTRIEGHLAVRVQVENGVVTDAFCSGEMFRGFEEILRGRHPLDAQQITQRICGVCPIEHGIASALAQDDAYRITPSKNGVLERNLVQAANYLHSHIIHFYGLCGVDFLDVTAILDYKGNDGGMQQLRDWVQRQIESKVYLPAAPFLPRYEGNYLTDKSLNLELLKHYTEALEVRRLCHELGALYGGKFPHMASIVPGGMSQTVDAGMISYSNGLLKKIKDFVVNKYVPDVVAVASAFPQYWKTGGGRHNFLAYGVFPEPGTGKHLLPPGVIIGDKFSPLDPGRITEDVAYSWFRSSSGLHPSRGETQPDPNKPNAYSWVKAPRYGGEPMEVGALARLLIAHAQNHEPVASAINSFLQKTGHVLQDLISVMGRHAARAIESLLLVDAMERWIAGLNPEEPPCVAFKIPDRGQGMGLTEAARGALGHWISIENHVIARYQCVVPTTWNCSPKDDRGKRGPVEEALIGTPVANEANPIEAVRVVRSFDPCLACAVH